MWNYVAVRFCSPHGNSLTHFSKLKYREINGFTLALESTKELTPSTKYLSSKISSVKVTSSLRHTVLLHSVDISEFYCHGFLQKFRQINVLLKNFTINWFDGNNLRGSEFLFYVVYQTPFMKLWFHEIFVNSWKLKPLFSKVHAKCVLQTFNFPITSRFSNVKFNDNSNFRENNLTRFLQRL